MVTIESEMPRFDIEQSRWRAEVSLGPPRPGSASPRRPAPSLHLTSRPGIYGWCVLVGILAHRRVCLVSGD